MIFKYKLITFVMIFICNVSNAFVMCRDIFTEFPKHYSVSAIYEEGVKPNVISRKNNLELSGKEIQFGFESEYTTDQFAKIADYYGPKDIKHEKWFNMSREDRAVELVNRTYRLVVVADNINIERKKSPDNVNYLPDQLVLDSTGNLEFVLPPMSSIKEYLAAREQINTLFETGSMQSTVSVGQKEFFGYLKNKYGNNPKIALAPLVGFSKFYFIFDTLDKLNSGYQRYQSNQNQEVARSFAHPFLEPMTKNKEDLWIKILEKNFVGEMMAKSDLAFIRYMDDSFKYVGGTTYRPDIAMPERLVWEIRDAHKNTRALQIRVERLKKFLEYIPDVFSKFSEIESFDSRSLFETKFLESTKVVMEKLFPSKAKQGIEYTESELVALGVHRNFSWPLQNWLPLLTALNASKTDKDNVFLLQDTYIHNVNMIANEYAAGNLNAEKAKILIQAELARFSKESNLMELMKDYENKNYN